MDSEGDTLWEKSASGSFFSYLTSDNHILYTTRTTIEKIDLNGNFIWQKPLNNINYLTEDSFGNYIYVKKRVTLYPGSLSAYGILDNAGNQVTQTEIPDDATNVISCSDGGFVISGKLRNISISRITSNIYNKNR